MCDNVYSKLEYRQSVRFDNTRRFLCIEHPGVVQDTAKAISTLGGLSAIAKIYAEPPKRLEMKWRPKDIYCKPAYGDRFSLTNFILKVKRRRQKWSNGKEGEWEYKVEAVGYIPATFRFQGMVDFQYLSAEKMDTGEHRSLIDDILIQNYNTYEDYINKDAPLFIPPLIFSRMDQPVEYLFRPQVVHKNQNADPSQSLPSDLIGTARQKRTLHTIFVNYEDEIPSKPMDRAIEYLRPKFNDPDYEKEIKQIFNDNPVWSKNKLAGVCKKCPRDKLKYILPLIAYFYLTGPWRGMWLRLGFDPKKDPTAKLYQTVDFRMRQRGHTDNLQINCKRSTFDFSLPTLFNKSVPQIAKIQMTNLNSESPKAASNTVSDADRRKQELTYKFYPNIPPPYRQMFYQMCDIHVPEVQKLVHANDGDETVCTERDGWGIKDITDKIRQVMYHYVEKLARGADFTVPSHRKKEFDEVKKLIKETGAATEAEVENEIASMADEFSSGLCEDLPDLPFEELSVGEDLTEEEDTLMASEINDCA